jgi:transposase
VVGYGLSTGFVAEQFGVSQRRVQQLAKHYREAGEVSVLRRPGGKLSSNHENLRDVVLWAKQKLKCSATGIAAYLCEKRGIRVDNNLMHKILLEEDLAVEEPNKKVRKQPWELKHVLCKYNHPQSNGKIEKWTHTYKRFRGEFDSLEECLHWYNHIGPHRSLNWRKLETPAQRFYESLQPFMLKNFMAWAEKEVTT